jgi:predicted KAP-like P-loop ATPase
MSEVLSSDKPITERSEDVLRYWPFASAIAAGLVASPREGFVVGIQAAWGMGKTSAVNLIIGAIRELEIRSAEDAQTVGAI